MILGELPAGSPLTTQAVVFGADHTWLQVPWTGAADADVAWVAGEHTDFPRTRAAEQIVNAWYTADEVLAVRRALVQDMLRLRKSPGDQIAAVAELNPNDLAALEETLTRAAVVKGYQAFWALSEHLGLPEPFHYLPVHPMPPAAIDQLVIDGFGPTMVAQDLGDVYYYETRGMSPGMEYTVPEGSPLIAVADGEIVNFTFLEHPAARSLALRPYLPPRFRTAYGERVLSNVIVAYGHLMGDPPSDLVRVGDVVRTGQVIGTSGWPVYTRSDGSVGVQGNNAHLHLETHLVTDGEALLGDELPFNPLLFWSPQMVALQARLAINAGRRPYPRDHARYGRLGFFTVGAFHTDLPDNVWDDRASDDAQPWPDSVYTLDALIEWARTLPPYPLDGTSNV